MQCDGMVGNVMFPAKMYGKASFRLIVCLVMFCYELVWQNYSLYDGKLGHFLFSAKMHVQTYFSFKVC